MPADSWQRRIDRVDQLTHQHDYAREMLTFYGKVARLQRDLSGQLAKTSGRFNEYPPSPEETRLLAERFPQFLRKLEAVAPTALAANSRGLRDRDAGSWAALLQSVLAGASGASPQPEQLLGRAFLQPYAELVRSRRSTRWEGYQHSVCPFCRNRPVVAVLRPLGDGGLRSLICSFCLAEWTFRRIVCAGCGEVNSHKLPVYMAEEFPHMRVECCESCKQYTKSVDLTKNGLAEPIVDEIAAVPLDLWAQEHGYAKIERNLVGM
jgi:FdhE protein